MAPTHNCHPLESEEEEVEQLPESIAIQDPLFKAHIVNNIGGVLFRGLVESICVGLVTHDRLYCVRYADDDAQHFLADELQPLLIDDDEVSNVQ